MQRYHTDRENPLALVVDDDLMSRLLVRKMLEQAGFLVEEAVNGAEALKVMGNLNPDIVILDVLMPVLDGYSTCTEIRRLGGDNMVPVLMMTGLDDSESIQKAYDCGATDFISKPINFLIMRYRVLYILRANKAFQKLKLSEARLAEAQRRAKIGSWEMNISTDEIIWSDEIYHIFGIEREEYNISDYTIANTTHPSELQKLAEQITEAFSEEKDFFLESKIIKSEGNVRSIRIEGNIDRDNEDKPTWVVGYIQDITNLRMS